MTHSRVRTKVDKWGNASSHAVERPVDAKAALAKPRIVGVLVVNPFAGTPEAWDECRVSNEVRRQVYDQYKLIVLSAAKRADRAADPKHPDPEVHSIAYAEHIEPPLAYQNLPRLAQLPPQK